MLIKVASVTHAIKDNKILYDKMFFHSEMIRFAFGGKITCIILSTKVKSLLFGGITPGGFASILSSMTKK